jgi:peptidoglycan/LPS O-acetylase OafA/YrhL
MNNPKKEHFIFLEWLRFFLGLYIIIFHTFHYSDSPSWVRQIFGMGFFATSTFFILSGFLLSHVYLKNHSNQAVCLKESGKNFLVKRFANLYPIHIFSMFLYVGIVFLIPYFNLTEGDLNSTIRFVVYDSNNGTPYEELKHYMGNSELIIAFLMNILMIQSWNPYYMMFNFPTWSISTLFFFYLLFPFIATRIHKIKNIGLFFLIINFIYILPVFFVIAFTDMGSPESGILHRNPLIRLPEFLAGIALCALYHRKKISNSLPERKHMILIFSLLVSGLFLAKILLEYASIELNSGNIFYHLFHNGMLLPLELLLIYYLVNININHNQFFENLAKRLGGASLSMFALHIPTYAIFIRVQKYLNDGIADYRYYVLYLLLTIIFCILFQEKFVSIFRKKIEYYLLKKYN